MTKGETNAKDQGIRLRETQGRQGRKRQRQVTNPLLAALIKQIPPEGEEWPTERQLAWLHLMAIAFGTVYGGDAAERLFGGKAPAMAPNVTPFRRREPSPNRIADYTFVIDTDGLVKRGTGERVMPSEVSGTLHDLRGDHADLETITWADGSQGIGDLGQVTISAA